MRGGLSEGLFVGLTGARLKAADLIYSGLATHFCPSERLPELESRLAALGERACDEAAIEEVIRDVAGGASPDEDGAVLERNRDSIAKCFSAEDAQGIERRLLELAGEKDEWAVKTLETLRRMSPTSVAVTIEACRRSGAPGVTVDDALKMEYRMAQRFVTRPQPFSDFHEGIRAVLIDKDNKPTWNPASAEDVSAEAVEAFFAPLEEDHPRGELVIH